MGKTNQVKPVDTKKVLYMLGIFIFSGLLLSSFLDANHYLEEYSLYTLWEFRIFTVCSAVLYFILVHYYHRRKKTIIN
ncbi:hypothetical protein N0O92_13010 [Alkalihalobacillus sp. MEB130]|uniref:hypothetical protein n=1 Tax=Alkalihalobacillus sp. MEB130 TaxID=2976704 RepID=UPI0028DED2F9|nr:hypothetical protein [Alkalihalobacillus sp. MEB130]MDT8861155.1 hypothetical protein [Alkalihalobacillus sp. MEB130]